MKELTDSHTLAMASNSKGRNVAIDFLRCMAIILVMFRHLVISGNSIPERFATFLNAAGWVGVDLFFVLSGFLVSGLIFKEYEKDQSFNPLSFLIKRGFKIYPTFYLFLGITWGMSVLFHYANTESNTKYIYEALFICNYTKLEPIHAWLWSICVEEHFYILLAIVITILIKLKLISIRSFTVIYFVFFAIALFGRIHNLPMTNFFLDYTPSHLHFDALFFGVLLCIIYRQKPQLKWNSTILTILSLIGISLPFIFSFNDLRYQEFVIIVLVATNPVCYGYLMVRMLNVRRAWMKPFAYVGKYSYSIYLFHGLINHLVLNHFSRWTYYALYFIGSIVIGIIISKTIEYPFLLLRDRIFAKAGKTTSQKGQFQMAMK